MIYYDQPAPGLDNDGNEVTCNQRVCMTREDVVKHQRWVMKQVGTSLGKRIDLSPERLFDEYMIVNWAWEE